MTKKKTSQKLREEIISLQQKLMPTTRYPRYLKFKVSLNLMVQQETYLDVERKEKFH